MRFSEEASGAHSINGLYINMEYRLYKKYFLSYIKLIIKYIKLVAF